MIKKILLFLIVALYSSNTFSTDKTFDDQQNRLVTLCKVWGVVNFYSSEVAKKKINWGEILIDSWHEFQHIKNNRDFNIFVSKLLALAKIKEVNITVSERKQINDNQNYILTAFDELRNKDALQIAGFSWIYRDLFLNIENKDKLASLLILYKPVKHKNIKKSEVIIFNHNLLVSTKSLTQAHFILGLFQYWNTINYFFPYKYLMDEDWENVLRDFAPNFRKINSFDEYEITIRKLSAKICDSHGEVEDESINDYNVSKIPVRLDIVEHKVVISKIVSDSISDIYNIHIGDVIEEINEETIASIWERYNSLYASSTLQGAEAFFTNFLWHMNNKNDSTATLKIEGRHSEHIVTVKTIPLDTFRKLSYANFPSKPKVNIIQDSIGYIKMSEERYLEIGRTYRKIKNKPYLIIDYRGYSTMAMINLINRLDKKPHDVFSNYAPSLKWPGIFIKGKNANGYAANTLTFLLKSRFLKNTQAKLFPSFKHIYKGKVIVLINREAMSASEAGIMAIEAYRPDAVLIGSATQGVNGTMSLIILPGNIKAWFSGNDLRYPDGAQLQRIGIMPDIYVDRTIQGLKNNRDEVLNAALDFIRNKN